MTDEERKEFLKKMGYSGTVTYTPSIVDRQKRREYKSRQVDKDALRALHRLFKEPKKP